MSTHKKSTLPSILDAYLPPQHKKQCDRGQKNRQQKTGEPGKHRKLTPLNEDEEDRKMKTRKACQEQRHLEVYKNMYKLWNAMRLQYMDLLSKKVQRQRHEIKERDLQFQRNIEEQEKKQNTTRRLFGQQSECSQLGHEIKYPQSIPKSHFYMIVELQDQLAKSGILKNQGDYEEFWRLLKQTSCAMQFETKLQDVKLKMIKSLPRFNKRPVQDPARSPCVARKRNNYLTKGGLPGLSTFQHINHLVSKQRKVQEETEQMFPKVMVPHPSAFQMFSTKQSNTQTVINSRPKSGIPGMKSLKKMQQKPHHRQQYLDKLYQMYRRSFANMAEAQRLLERSGHFMEFEEPSIQDFMFCQEIDTTERVTQSQRTSIGVFPALNAAYLCEESNSRSLKEFEKQDETSGGINMEAVSQKLNEQSWNQAPPDPVNVYVPLTIEEILQNNYIVEAKRPSSLWINYTNTGMREAKGLEQTLSTEYSLNTTPTILVTKGGGKGFN
ncbi:uncharacterized protein si:ch211-130h14.4 isoform X1 [Carcharodon carcharias]|uniref:uncharacterized protein si:ch211-130h14.4 isoform X1 n=1 Tax=Carcharodon carcharias TaxID=13397 RepID=UPI001B7EB81A|nr:uncharacterized protein si:ch211-130h14.4 isoform X1 [Carcharodon carcharias]XP_041036043.1 uncharacterized protein si:ch211-130h14.4 isoform X1 [Carcharodon carcharias]